MGGKKGGKGGRNRRKGKGDAFGEKRELIVKDEEQGNHIHQAEMSDTEYAQVVKMLGNARLEAQCVDGIRRLCQIRGKMRKKVWINMGDVVLVSLRSYEDEKGDIIHKYNPDEVRALKAIKEIPEGFRVVDTVGGDGYDKGESDDDIGFEEDDDKDAIDILDV